MTTTKSTRIPSYRLHRPSGQAVVTLDGRDIYLGLWNSDENRARYDRAVAEWIANGRRMVVERQNETEALELTIVELIAAYTDFAASYYRKDNRETSEVSSIKQSMRPLRKLYSREAAKKFGPLALRTVREEMIKGNLARGTINRNIDRIRRMFRWATQHEMVPPSVYQALQCVDGLKRGRCTARETDPIKPVAEEVARAVFPHVSAEVRAMIELQLLTGMRSGEVTIMRGCDLDISGPIWAYHPREHKTEHHGIERTIYLGPKAQVVIRPFLRANTTAYLFDARGAETSRSIRRRRERKSPMTPSQAKRRPKRQRKRAPAEHYSRDSYRRAISRACAKAGIPNWHPHQLRHTAATLLRKQFGIEAARVVLGHQSAQITEVYAEIDQSKARDVMARIG